MDIVSSDNVNHNTKTEQESEKNSGLILVFDIIVISVIKYMSGYFF